MKILIACMSFKKLTGSEIYIFELAKNLIKFNHDITIASYYLGDPLVSLANNLRIQCVSIDNLNDIEYDLIHCQHTPVVNFLVDKFPNILKVCTIHSEIISLENPIIHDSIKKYIAIRPSIKEHLEQKYKIESSKIEIIFNPIDETKFFPKETKNHNSILFVGTVDYLRKNTIYDLINTSKKENKNLWIIGDNQSDYLNDILKYDHVFYHESTYDISKYTQSCNETAGIMLGRTTIEGWMCGKPGWIYEVDNNGLILNKKLHNPPNDIEKFHSSNVAKQINKIYTSL